MSGDKPFIGFSVKIFDRAVADFKFIRLTMMYPPLPVNGLYLTDAAPGLTTPGTGVHRQSATHCSGNPGQKFSAGKIVAGGKTCHFSTGDTGFGA